ncbi:MAG: ferritin family protein [Alphaproteobacteria bacterium]|nr:ferritin family protein [Alphaproteobacteria bacterium]
MNDLPTFLAHAVALEREAAERYAELADTLEAHHNAEAAELFRRLAHFSRLHQAEVEERAKGHALPHLAPWQYKWDEPEGPESAPIERTHYLMTPYHVLHLALTNERKGMAYYAKVAAESTDPDIRRMAKEMADEESEHVVMLEEWIKKVPEPDADWDEDTDPPVVAD